MQQSWLEWLRARLPSELAVHLVSAVPRAIFQAGGGSAEGIELVMFADSGAWCTRLRYALAALQGELRAHAPTLTRTSVRVQRHGGER